jgi:microcystin-dependent protein
LARQLQGNPPRYFTQRLNTDLTLAMAAINNLGEYLFIYSRQIYSVSPHNTAGTESKVCKRASDEGGVMGQQPVLGQIMPFAGSVVPRGWLPCNGALLPINQNAALFSLLGTAYGGNGTTTFALPDLQGRALLGSTGNGGNFPAGMVAGTTTVNLTTAQIPSHNHIIQASTTAGAGRGASPAGHLFGANTAPANDPDKIFLTAGTAETNLASATNVVNDGGGQAHNNMQPYLVISYLIAVNGIFPSRN